MKLQHHATAVLWKYLSWLALVLLLPGAAHAQSMKIATEKTGRPKICLVLSGGGARGAAHVGVIRVLEEQRVPIDCVVGTSMGALVGAAYASGMTLAEMEQFTSNITSDLLFKDKPPREQRTMRNKQDDYTILFTPEMGVKDGAPRVGKGIVSGVQLESVLRQLSKTKGYYDFDKLPMQYRAVATDLVTGKAVVFDKGELAMVMRASMSVPGAMAPAEFDGMILVDGMLTSNLPVQTARALGADIIIAVNVGTPLLKREELGGILGVTGQMLSILTEQNVQESLAQLQPTDILISPDLQEYSTGDFDSLPQIVPLGEVAARKEIDRLAALSLPPQQYATLRQQQTLPVVPDDRPIDEIRIDRVARTTPAFVRSFMETQEGEPVDQKVLDEDMRRIYGSGDYEHTGYRFLDEHGKHILSVEAQENSWGPDYLRFGLGLSSDFSGDAYFDLLASYRKTWLDSLGAEWRTDVQFGRTDRLFSEFYQPLNDNHYFFVAPYVELMRHTTDLYRDEDRVATYDTRSTLAGIDLGSQFYRYGELRLGTQFGELNPELDTGVQALSPGESSVQVGAYTMRLQFDQLDSVNFPRRGWNAGAKLFNANEGLGSDENYTKWNAHGTTALSYGEHTLHFALKAGGVLGDDSLPRYDQFQWGGLLRQGGYANGQLAGEELLYGRIAYYHRIMRGTFLDGAYGGVAFEMSEIDNPLVPGNSDAWLRSGSVFIGSDTPIGPAYLGFGHADDGNQAVYFYLGNPF